MSLDNAGNIPNDGVMAKHIELTEIDIRNALIKRAEAYAKRADTSLSAISAEAVNDSKFLKRVNTPTIGFNIKTYQKMVDWLDKAERRLEKKAAAQ